MRSWRRRPLAAEALLGDETPSAGLSQSPYTPNLTVYDVATTLALMLEAFAIHAAATRGRDEDPARVFE